MIVRECSECGKVEPYGHIDALCLSCYSKEHTPKEIRIRKNQERLFDFLNDKECSDCQEPDSGVLQFDHVRGVKIENVTTMVSRRYAWDTILEEIAKCEIVCANCHTRRTARRGGFWRADISTAAPDDFGD